MDKTKPKMCEVCGGCNGHQYSCEYDWPLALLNTTIATADGSYTLETITLDKARWWVSGALTNGSIFSAIGHEATAYVMGRLLNAEVAVNRVQFAQQPGQCAVVLKIKGRIPEGQVLTIEQMEAIGYEFKLLRRTA